MNFFKSTPKPIMSGGVLFDVRTDSEKALDWHISEHTDVAGGNDDPYRFEPVTSSVYADENQYRTSACVAHAVGTATEFAGDSRPAHLLFYRTRSGYPAEGCVPFEMVQKASKYYLPKWEDSPTPFAASEDYANLLPLPKLVARDIALPYFKCNTARDVALASSVGCGVPITIYATNDEWSQQIVELKIPELTGDDPRAVWHHEVFVLPYSGFTSKTGETYVCIADSSPTKGFSIRHVNSKFLDIRMTTAYAFLPTTPAKPSAAKPTVACKYGETSPAVTRLQKFMQMPVELQTGFYGMATASYVLKWQLVNKIDAPAHLQELGGKYWGKLSISNITK